MKKMTTRFTIALLSLSLAGAPAMAATAVTAPAAVEATTSTAASEAVMMNAAKEAWGSLSRAERKSRIAAVKDAVSNLKEASTNTILLVILSLILPPLAVYLHQGTINSKFWISLILTLLFWVPGVIYSLLVVLGAV